jgi:Flp pilus assembly protein TadG
MGDRIKRALFILMRLYHNQAGNTLAIVAAAVIPLAALIGGGVDMSRAYMAKARLQQACDAGALAGRRSMTTSSMTSADIAEAQKFFNFNFPQNTFQTDSFTPNIRSDPAQTTTVLVSASTRIPTTIMRILNFQYINLSVSCSSKFDIGNTDVMLVLDTTGSMDSNISDGNGGTTTRIAALRQAVRDFYDTLGPGNTNTGRVRYGFLPYASNANVGYLLPSSALIGGTAGDTWTYNSRIGTYYAENGSTTTTCYIRRGGNGSCYTSSSSANSASSGGTYSKSSCTNWGNSSSTTSGTPPSSTSTTTYSYDSWNGDTSANPSGGGNQKCVRKEVTVTKTYDTNTTGGAGWTRYGWQYQSVAQAVSNYVTGDAVTNPAYDNGTTSTWAGCIEEPDTITTINSSTSTSSVPSGANDLNIDLIPSSTATRWRPFWPDVSWYRSSTPASSPYWSSWSGDQAACPTRARSLAEYTSRSATPSNDTSGLTFDAYLDALTPWGFTNHTTGMIWGARMMSPDGIFASNNGAAPNGFSISRHIVFMTDGAMTASDGNYDGWGINRLDGRIAATNTSTTDLVTIQNKRFEIACEAAKRKGITIWVIVFASSSNSSLNACASSSDHVAVSTNASSLSTQFKTIAQNIGGLRLSQ